MIENLSQFATASTAFAVIPNLPEEFEANRHSDELERSETPAPRSPASSEVGRPVNGSGETPAPGNRDTATKNNPDANSTAYVLRLNPDTATNADSVGFVLRLKQSSETDKEPSESTSAESTEPPQQETRSRWSFWPCGIL
eukprot:GHVP01015613.1.p1 GENE.GHVP01015613.1~~GHVP01015613.1.p1  ORF type:complete len:141 (-),score=19.27 GHVP01015613.1:35-457(-)